MEDLNVILSHENIVSQKHLQQNFNFNVFQNLSGSESSQILRSSDYRDFNETRSKVQKPQSLKNLEDRPIFFVSPGEQEKRSQKELVDLFLEPNQHMSRKFDSYKNQQ